MLSWTFQGTYRWSIIAITVAIVSWHVYMIVLVIVKHDHAMLRVAWHGNIWEKNGGYVHNENLDSLKKFRGEYGRDRVGFLD